MNATHAKHARSTHHSAGAGRRGSQRRGSVLVVVLALLSALMLLGFLFYTSASQERENARYYAQSEKWYSTSLDGDALFDFALEQVIVGPQDDYANSALWGGRYSLLANLVGTDITPYSGPGVNVADRGQISGALTPDGFPVVDQDHDSAFDTTFNFDASTFDPGGTFVDDRLALHMGDWVSNLNAAGTPLTILPILREDPANPALDEYQGSGVAGTSPNGIMPEPDANYTYPDINSLFLAYVGTEPLSGRQVIIPSFHRPQYLRGIGTAAMFGQWYTHPGSLTFTLRPHTERLIKYFNYNTGLIETSTLPRFLDSAWDTAAAPGTTDPLKLATQLEEGVWNNLTQEQDADVVFEPEYDVDANDDGVKEAVYLDLDHPVEETADGTQAFIPMYGITIFDLDALFNLNAHGNVYGAPELLANPFRNPAALAGPNTAFISRSNEGRHRHEVNPGVGLTAPPSDAGTEHSDFFGGLPSTPVELANMEFWFILAGRVDKSTATNTIDQIYPGRWGDADLLKAASLANSNSPYDYPMPGIPKRDDISTSDANRALDYQDINGSVFPQFLPTLPPGTNRFVLDAGRHPEDYQGAGSYVLTAPPGPPVPGNGVTPNLVGLLSDLGARVSVLQYANYWFPDTLPLSDFGPLWATAQFVDPATFVPPILINALNGVRSTLAGGYGPRLAGRFVDDPGETVLDAYLARTQIADSIFGAQETAALHLSNNDFDASGMISRLLKLVPANFKNPEIRERYTTLSSDLKAYGNAVGMRWVGDTRAWETGNDLTYTPPQTGYENNVFPPYFFGEDAADLTRNTYGFRAEARGLLQQQGVVPGSRGALAMDREVVKGLVHKLSVNHVAAQALETRDGRPRFLLRPLTPHPEEGMKADVIPQPNIADNPDGTPFRTIPTANIGGPTDRPMFGMPDSWVIWSGLATWNMSNADPTYYENANIVDSTGTAWPEALQEWHARRDRQNMARDIYTLLYTFSHVDPAMDTTTTDNATYAVYDKPALHEMAQFAVNVVDAMDTDDTITVFIYDKNLADGYTLLDNGYDNANAIPLDPLTDHYENADRGMVFGVEAQQLAFSEALAIFAKKNTSDHQATLWLDTEHRDYTFAELQNMSPAPVTLDGGWSVVCAPAVSAGGTLILATPPKPRSLTILDESVAEPGETYTIGTAGDGHINPAFPTPPDGQTYYDSHLLVDPTGGPPPDLASFTRIAPAATNADDVLQFDAINAALADLRVNEYVDANPWDDSLEITTVTPESGAWLHLSDDPAELDPIIAGDVTVTFHLRRRINLHRDFPLQNDTTATPNGDDAQQYDNRWVEVDVMEVPLRVFDLTGPSLQQNLQNEIVSTKRKEPLSRRNSLGTNIFEAANPADPNADRNVDADRTNNLGGYHAADIDPATRAKIWQRHYDRAFASIADVLQVPLYGPAELTKFVNDRTILTGEPPAVADQTAAAMARFLFPDGTPRRVEIPPGSGAWTPIRPDGNLWYRILEFVEVPEKYGNPDGWPWFVDYAGPAPWGVPREQEELRTRRFGKINLNTVRHPHVLGGLLDDPRVMTPWFQQPPVPTPPGVAGNGYLPSANAEITANTVSLGEPAFRRDWWTALLASRDGGLDQFSINEGLGRMILPGVPAADPFKGFSVAPVGIGGAAPIDEQIHRTFSETLLRPMFGDDPVPTFDPLTDKGRRSLFALGNVSNSAQWVEGSLGSQADLATRFRLLGKVLNHGTTRSNSYVIFMTCDFFEAYQAVDGNGQTVYQIGQKIPSDSDKPEEPRYRGVFVLDRTLALELLNKSDLPPVQPRLVYPQGSKYRTFSFARQRGPDGNAEPTFDWSKLIQYRKIVKSE